MHFRKKSIDHIPVLISGFKHIFPSVEGIWVDGTFGFGGYSDYLLTAGVKKLIALDIDPEVKQYVDRLKKKWPNKIDFYIYRHIDICVFL